jgi:hypothetical protein
MYSGTDWDKKAMIFNRNLYRELRIFKSCLLFY